MKTTFIKTAEVQAKLFYALKTEIAKKDLKIKNKKNKIK